MATEEKSEYTHKLLVIGGGSGGLGCARRAAQYLPKTGDPPKADIVMFERQTRTDKPGEVRLGGTCVNVGCVPKKMMWNTANLYSLVRELGSAYGFEIPDEAKNDDELKLGFNFATIKANRDAHIGRLDDIYVRNTKGMHVVNSFVRFVDRHTVEDASGARYSAEKIVIATGGYPYIPSFLSEGDRDLVMTSDDFFYKLDQLPKKTAVVGAGYIAVELGQVLQSLGSDVSLFIRRDFPLRSFDILIQQGAREAIEHSGVNLVRNTTIGAIERGENGTKTLVSTEGQRFEGFDCVIYAIGRGPLESELNLSSIGVYQDGRGFVETDEFERCLDKASREPIDNLFAIGDINAKIALTPVAIRAGRAIGDREFGPEEFANEKCDYDCVPSVVFTHPPVGSCGLAQREVIRRIKAGELPGPLRRYETHFDNLIYSVYPSSNREKRVKTHMKVLCVGEEERVVGLHMIGDGCDEVLQGFGVAMKMGCTKKDLDSCVAIHPTAAEELVTLGRNARSETYVGTYLYDGYKEETGVGAVGQVDEAVRKAWLASKGLLMEE